MPKVFVSYSWDNDVHQAWVLDLATRLRRNGVDVTLDQWHVEPGDDLPAFMERSVRESEYVLIICSPKYKTKADERTGGVGYEGSVITGELVTGTSRRKFVPLLRAGSWAVAAPSWLLGAVYIDVRSDPEVATGFQELLKTLWRKRLAPPTLGNNPFTAVEAPPVACAPGDDGATNPPIATSEKLNELIAILNDRAERIVADVGRLYKYAKPREYLEGFKLLHERHVASLARGDFIRAHETLREIYDLSRKLESDEFWTRHRLKTPTVRYSLKPDAFERGPMVEVYCGAAHRRLRGAFVIKGEERAEGVYALILNEPTEELDDPLRHLVGRPRRVK